MSKRISIISTMSADVNYRTFGASRGDVPVPSGGIVIKGGANVAQGSSLWTPQGVSTPVSAEQLEQLEASSLFCKHRDGGYLLVVNAENVEVEAVVADMVSADASAPITENDFIGADPSKEAVPHVNGDTDPNPATPTAARNKRRA